MASSIDATKPIAGNPTTASVRTNFATAKSEIEALQADVAALEAGSVPDSSESTKGIIQLATPTEVNTGTDALKAVTPAGIEAWTGSVQITQVGIIATGTWQASVIGTSYLPAASTAASGIVRLATGTETNTGTAIDRAVTPDALDDWDGSPRITQLGTIATGVWQGTAIGTSYLPAASEGGSGIVELATTTEAAGGTDTARAVTAAGVAEAALPRLSTINTQTGTTYTLVDSDKGKDIVFTSASTVTVTIPGTLAVSFQCTCSKLGAGNLVFTSADNLNGAAPDLTLSTQWATAFLLQYSEGNWLVSGDVA